MAANDSSRFSFTKEKIADLPSPAKGRFTYHDQKMRGLQLRVSSTGVKSFSVFRRVKGGEAGRVTLGKFPAMTVEQARKEASKIIAEFENGANPAAAKRTVRGEPTLQEVFDDYLVHKRKRDGSALSDRTVAEYREIAGRNLFGFMAQRLSGISHEQVARLHHKIGKDSRYAANRAKALISAIFNFAKAKRTFAGDNPAAGVLSYAEEARERFVQASEVPYLFRAISESDQRDYFLLLLLTGARRSNVQAMRWQDVDLADAIWRIGKTKNGTPQYVPLLPEAVTILEARMGAAEADHEARTDKSIVFCPFVFPGTGKTGHLVEPKKAWDTVRHKASFARLMDALHAKGAIDDAAREAIRAEASRSLGNAKLKCQVLAASHGLDPKLFDMTDLRLHDLRRTMGSWQAKTGASMAIIGKSLNHKSPQATLIYSRLDVDPVRQSMETAASAMFAAATATPVSAS